MVEISLFEANCDLLSHKNNKLKHTSVNELNRILNKSKVKEVGF
jgi:hypothetical protein